ncbi:MAG: hypothetical protein JST68_24485 [Bacteroidetes bacterium]|nr:hypothetical protein [Bacteroidota bacterium]
MIVTPALCEAFAGFLLKVPARRFKEDLIKTFQAYVRQQSDGEWAKPTASYLSDLMAFFDFLDIIDNEASPS